MPELAEVEYFRKQWSVGLDRKVKQVLVKVKSRVLREVNPKSLSDRLTDSYLRESYTSGKQMLFRFSAGNLSSKEFGWLGVHLGMTGKLFHQPLPYAPGKHDHLVLEMTNQALVFQDMRLFGKILFQVGSQPPDYWTQRPPDLLSSAFTRRDLEDFLKRRAKSPLKAVLLDQERFPGIGNWMADEILWQAEIHPATRAGALEEDQVKKLYQKIKYVCGRALKYVSDAHGDPPQSWLFQHRWKDGGNCPKTGEPLVREKIGGRTTCFSPARQGEA